MSEYGSLHHKDLQRYPPIYGLSTYKLTPLLMICSVPI